MTWSGPSWLPVAPAQVHGRSLAGASNCIDVFCGHGVGLISRAAAVRADGGGSAALAAAAGAGSQRPPGPRADQPDRPSADPGVLPPGPAAGRAAGIGRGAARRTGATPTTPWTLPAAGSCWRRRAGRCTRRSGRASPRLPRPGRPARVLFLCTGNGARSQLAEALAQRRSGGLVQAFSAGSHPRSLHPNTVRVMAEHGIDVRGRAAKHLSVFAADRFGYVITLCDRVREVCPEFPGHPRHIHWSIPDPAAAGDTDEASYPAFQADRGRARGPASASCSPRSPPRRPVQPTRRRDDKPARDGERPLHGR